MNSKEKSDISNKSKILTINNGNPITKAKKEK